jgi:hypothetical protein
MFEWIPDLHDFIAKHGRRPAKLRHKWLLPDGAVIIPDGQMYLQPPSDPEERLKRQLEYCTLRLKWAEEALAGLGSGIRWDSDRLGPMPTATDNTGNPDLTAIKRRLERLLAFRKDALETVQNQLDKRLSMPPT